MYYVLQGDVVEQLSLMDDSSVDVIVTDPPYNLGMDAWDKWESNAAFSQWCQEWGTEAYRVIRPGGVIMSFSANRTYHWLAVALEQSGFTTKDMIEWVYWGTMPRGKGLKSCHEPIYVGVKGTALNFNVDECRVPLDKKTKGDMERFLIPNQPAGKHPGRKAYAGETESKKFGTAMDDKPYTMNESGRHPFNVLTTTIAEATFPTNVLDIRKPRGKESIKGHQTQKPIALMRWLIELASQPGDTVLDCFGGTGTTGHAALDCGRDVILIEREQDYIDIIHERLQPLLED